MAMQATVNQRIGDGGKQTVVASGAVVPGAIVQNVHFGVVQQSSGANFASGDEMTVEIDGLYAIVKTTKANTFAVGADVHVDVATQKALTTGGTGKCGTAAQASTADDDTVYCDFSKQ